MTNERHGIQIALLHHGTLTDDPCALCGARYDPCGLDFVLAGTVALVCDDCALKHAPQLCGLLQARAHSTCTIQPPSPQNAAITEIEPERPGVAHFIGVCLLCLQKCPLIKVRGQGFYHCATDRVYWDQSCDRQFFQSGNEYDKAESGQNEAMLADYVYIEDYVKVVFREINKARTSVERGPAGDDEIKIEHIPHEPGCARGNGGNCNCGAQSVFVLTTRRRFESEFFTPRGASSQTSGPDSDYPF